MALKKKIYHHLRPSFICFISRKAEGGDQNQKPFYYSGELEMEIPRFYYTLVLFLVICYCNDWCHGCLDEEKEALLQIKDSIIKANGSSKDLSTWVGEDCCEWRGVTCDESTPHVTLIDLKDRRKGKSGTWYPNPTLFSRFKQLEEIDLSNNQMGGNGTQILQAFCELKFLEILNLHHNLLTGGIPSCLGNMPLLRVLGLARTGLGGSFPSFLSNLTRIEEIDVAHNQFYGIVSLSIFSNRTNLITLILSNNHLEVETEPPTWVPSFQLGALYLSNCNLNKNRGNVIPSFFSNQYNLVRLDLSHNSLEGSIPTWMLYNVTQLLSLKDNKLHGHFPSRTGDESSGLSGLDLSDNNIFGSLPVDIGMQFPYLLFFNMSTNNLQGNVPPSFTTMEYLELLDLSNNNLTGEIPESLTMDRSSLQYLILSNNGLQGKLLRNCNLTSLKLLQLHSNRFTGSFPPCLSNSPKLEYIDIRNNHLSSNLSSSLPIIPYAKVLLLGSNAFKSQIPKQLCQMKNLQFLDLSNNSLLGNIPSCFNQVTSWKNLSLSSNGTTLGNRVSPLRSVGIRITAEYTTKGISYIYEGGPLALMTGIDMSHNQLAGNIPSEMGDLVELRTLNLSYNFLTGHLPVSFQKLRVLESLDLSQNELNGTIPHQLVQMTSLSTFNVAFNNLSGRIPYEQQFHTFPESSFTGNSYLCGELLKKSCQPENPPQYPIEEEEHQILDRPLFFYLFVLASYALGFWSVIGVLIFKRDWRREYFRVVDRHIDSCFEKFSLFSHCLKM